MDPYAERRDRAAHAGARKVAAGQISMRSRERVTSSLANVGRSQVRLERTSELQRSTQPLVSHRLERSTSHTNVLALPPAVPSVASEREVLAPLIDLLEHRARRLERQRRVLRIRLDLLLGEILWNVGEEKARPVIESALALLTGLQAPATSPEIEALREWLDCHPL